MNQLQNAKAICDTVEFIANTTESEDDGTLKPFGGDVYGYLSEHFIMLQRLTTLGAKISPEPSEYEILLQYLRLQTGNYHYDVAEAMEDSRIYNRDVLDRINASLKEASKLMKDTATPKA